MGIEALSRGAKSCVFVERDRKALEILRGNLRRCGFESRSRVLGGELPAILRRLVASESFDLVFADPPYGDPAGELVLDRIGILGLVGADSVIVFEHPASGNPLSGARSLALQRSVRYGDTVLSFFRRDGGDRSRAEKV